MTRRSSHLCITEGTGLGGPWNCEGRGILVEHHNLGAPEVVTEQRENTGQQ